MADAVTIHMTLHQKNAGAAESERSTFTYHGHRAARGGKMFLSYQETDSAPNASAACEHGMTMLVLSPDEITMSRRGAVTANMTFRPGETTPCRYATAAGILLLEVRTREASYDDAHILLDYELLQAGDMLCENRLEIRVEDEDR